MSFRTGIGVERSLKSALKDEYGSNGNYENDALRATSVVRVTARFAQLVREARVKPEFEHFSPAHTMTVIDAHSSVLKYVSIVMPRNVKNCFIPGDCHYRCDDLLKEVK